MTGFNTAELSMREVILGDADIQRTNTQIDDDDRIKGYKTNISSTKISTILRIKFGNEPHSVIHLCYFHYSRQNGYLMP